MKKSMISTVKTAATAVLAKQPELAKTAALLEGSDLLISRAIAIAEPKLPFWAKGYAKTPVFKALVANALMVAVEVARPDTGEEDIYKQIASAGAVKSYQEVIGSFNLGDMLDELFSGKEMKSLIEKAGKGTKAVKAPKAGKAVAPPAE